ncbi:chondroitin sulfate synthase 1-like [Ptychodera flava]|uniref:chondroitin sulfate synthase 1-like n=1 Tax=Ptychodera flava TaxID=63121 RepID=UPI00396A9583
MMLRRSRGCPRKLWSIFMGLLCGFFLATWLRLRVVPTMGTCYDQEVNDFGMEIRTQKPPDTGKSFIFVGVMTAKMYLSTRAAAVNRTWARTIPGKVSFFSSADSNSSSLGLPLVSLPGVDDSYPPQKKSFMMLKYMHDNYIDKYEWFMRADDDVFIRSNKLESFLRSVNSTRSLFIGQAGLGNQDDFGKLFLNHGENFCMGGPGMIFSRDTLRRIVPNISYCLKNLYSTHEDVEVGRCVRKFAGVDCTWSYEMQQLFYHKYFVKDAFIGNIHTSEVHQAVTLHPIKNIPYFYRMHSYLESQKIADLQLKTLRTLREIREMNQLLKIPTIDQKKESVELGLNPDLMRFVPSSHNDVIMWDFFTKYMYSWQSDNPRAGLSKNLQAAMDSTVMQIMEMINMNALSRGRTIDFQEILYGYQRLNPQLGVDYVLDLLLLYRRHKGKKRNVPVRRHAYLHQSFGKIEFQEEIEEKPVLKLPSNKMRTPKPLVKFRNAAADKGAQWNTLSRYSKHTIHFVLPLAGRFETFKRFMENIERACLITKEDVKLVIVLFKTANNDQSLEIVKLIAVYQQKYPHTELRIVNAVGEFSRGLALELGASQFPGDALMFFVDVDMYFTAGFLNRCRQNTKQGQQVYYPEVFSQFEPKVVYPRKRSTSNIIINKESGIIRSYGFGIVCAYNGDVSHVGGMDASIVGWGMEDVDLYNKFIKSNITVFRAPDVGLVHIYHEILCDPNLDPKQYQMCLGSRASIYGSASQLSDILQKSKHQNNGNTKR